MWSLPASPIPWSCFSMFLSIFERLNKRSTHAPFSSYLYFRQLLFREEYSARYIRCLHEKWLPDLILTFDFIRIFPHCATHMHFHFEYVLKELTQICSLFRVNLKLMCTALKRLVCIRSNWLWTFVIQFSWWIFNVCNNSIRRLFIEYENIAKLELSSQPCKILCNWPPVKTAFDWNRNFVNYLWSWRENF